MVGNRVRRIRSTWGYRLRLARNVLNPATPRSEYLHFQDPGGLRAAVPPAHLSLGDAGHRVALAHPRRPAQIDEVPAQAVRRLAPQAVPVHREHGREHWSQPPSPPADQPTYFRRHSVLDDFLGFPSFVGHAHNLSSGSRIRIDEFANGGWGEVNSCSWKTSTQQCLFGQLDLPVDPLRRMEDWQSPVGPEPRWF